MGSRIFLLPIFIDTPPQSIRGIFPEVSGREKFPAGISTISGFFYQFEAQKLRKKPNLQ